MLSDLEQRIGYVFNNRQLLLQALTHRSYIFENEDQGTSDNETLEFLGDAVLDLCVGHILYDRFPKMKEGDLTKLRATLVQESHLAIVSGELGLGKCVLLGKGEESSNGREKPSIMACTLEALVGAVYLDAGYDLCFELVEKHFAGKIDGVNQNALEADAKSRLQELTQAKFRETPEYILAKAHGPDHDKTFTASVRFHGKILATASAKSKKAAEQKAAAQAITEFTDILD